MVPVRRADPIGAIGAYWARPHAATPDEVGVLQSLADAAALANPRSPEVLIRTICDLLGR